MLAIRPDGVRRARYLTTAEALFTCYLSSLSITRRQLLVFPF
jgi:hypothetical protein